MKLLLSILTALLVLSGSAQAAAIYSATITVTNAAGTTNGQTLTIQGDLRTWTNSVSAPLTQIKTNSSAAGATANLLNHLAYSPVAGLSVFISSTTALRITSTNGAAWFAVTPSAGWAAVTYTTNTITPAVVLRVPFSVETAAQRTNVASEIAALLSSGVSTNPIVVDYSAQSGHATNADLVALATVAITATNAQQAAHATNSDAATLASFVSGTLSNSISGNAATATTATTASFVLQSTLTNQVLASKLLSSTNVTTPVIDFNVPDSDYQTNAAFNFTGFININPTNYNSAVTFVTNSTAAAVAIGCPASVHAQGVWYVTNFTVISWFCTAGRITNAIAAPQF